MSDPQMVGVPLYQPLNTRDSTVAKDSRLINGFVEKDQGAEGTELWVYKRPGYVERGRFGTGTGLGVFNWQGEIYSIFGTTLYKSGVSVGTVDGSGPYRFTSTLGATPQLFLKNYTHAYVYDSGGGLVQVTDGDYPSTTVLGTAYLDGGVYVMTPDGHIQGSDINDATSWDPLNSLQAQIEPDFAQCLIKSLVYVIAVKTISTEVFYDAGNGTGSPLGPVQGSKVGVGARAATSVVQCGDDFAFVGTTSEGSVNVMFFSKVHAEPISTPPVERMLENLDFTVTYAWAARIAGHRFYVVTIKNANLTLAFDLTSNAWYIWKDPNGNYLPIVSATYDSLANPVLQHESNGRLYTFDTSAYQDDGVNFQVSLFTANVDGGIRSYKTCSTIDVVADEIDTEVDISWSDDDYQTFTTPQATNLNHETVRIQDGGRFRKRAFCVTHQDNTPLRIKALNMIIAAGEN